MFSKIIPLVAAKLFILVSVLKTRSNRTIRNCNTILCQNEKLPVLLDCDNAMFYDIFSCFNAILMWPTNKLRQT